MHPSIRERCPEIIGLCQEYGVSRLEVFGSAAHGKDFDPAKSDYDFLVDFETGGNLSPLRQFFGLADAFERLLGRPVDLVETGAISNPYLLASINRSRELIYET